MTHVKKHSRREPLAAARYLKRLYQIFRDWPLPLAAYNSGENRILRLQSETGSTDFWELAAKDVLPRETRSYVPAVLAVISLFAHRNVIWETE